MTSEHAAIKLDAAFDFFAKLGAPFFCFHDVDAMADYGTIGEYSANLAAITDAMIANSIARNFTCCFK